MIQTLLENGTDHVVIDEGEVYQQVRALYPDGVNKVLELIGTRTLKDSLKCIAPKGMVCMTGILGNEWTMKDFTPMGDIPSMGRLTVYMGESKHLSKDLLQEFMDQVAEAHQYMEDNKARGKLVVVV